MDVALEERFAVKRVPWFACLLTSDSHDMMLCYPSFFAMLTSQLSLDRDAMLSKFHHHFDASVISGTTSAQSRSSVTPLEYC